jgi:hypothetical protein
MAAKYRTYAETLSPVTPTPINVKKETDVFPKAALNINVSQQNPDRHDLSITCSFDEKMLLTSEIKAKKSENAELEH